MISNACLPAVLPSAIVIKLALAPPIEKIPIKIPKKIANTSPA